MHIDQSDLFAGNAVDIFLYGLADTAHGDDDMFRVGCAVIVEQPVGGTQPSVNFRQLLLHDLGQRQIERIGSLSRLEKDIGILRGTIHFTV